GPRLEIGKLGGRPEKLWVGRFDRVASRVEPEKSQGIGAASLHDLPRARAEYGDVGAHGVPFRVLHRDEHGGLISFPLWKGDFEVRAGAAPGSNVHDHALWSD